MGDRISLSFRNGGEESIALFSHWGGMDFVRTAKTYVRELKLYLAKRGNPVLSPLDRLEPNTVMVDFVRALTAKLERVSSDYYFGRDGTDGDNSDNGHHIIELSNEVVVA